MLFVKLEEYVVLIGIKALCMFRGHKNDLFAIVVDPFVGLDIIHVHLILTPWHLDGIMDIFGVLKCLYWVIIVALR